MCMWVYVWVSGKLTKVDVEEEKLEEESKRGKRQDHEDERSTKHPGVVREGEEDLMLCGLTVAVEKKQLAPKEMGAEQSTYSLRQKPCG
jgi:hypothetical protein